ncbi:hypothetical protein R77567_01654 [Ralstonia sp. LMG 32965]|uniref:DUF1566 domain-containing protein n=1 Tax=Ralstonia flatus TaxID=3058601 RepID=A0AAD2F454_9RALS|nr:DUF1566 domain-containing protein [Ralstonia sp. LMG 32965]CAJ0862505.1 hypothetical protein R77567_01654 [Ralstonia sp. LMG 32965]
MTITLQAIKAEHNKVAEMIAAFEKQATSEYRVAGGTIQLNPGERYAGLILGKDGEPDHHVILLPGDEAELNWDDAKKWAKDQGGELPSRREQSLLYANLKEEFQGTWYWSSEAHERESGWAWYQVFNGGYQDITRQGPELRARAVRRLILL